MRLLRLFLADRFDPDSRIRVLQSSKDPALAAYFDAMKALGSTDFDFDTGLIFVKIHDAGGAGVGTWLEEYAHALQYLRHGNVPLSVDDLERNRREIETAQCILEHCERLKLGVSEQQYLQDCIKFYQQQAA
jgi:hypothetical protein